MMSSEKQSKDNGMKGGENREMLRNYFSCCNWQGLYGNKLNRGIRFGILLIVIGLFWYGIKVEWFPTQWVNARVFAPVVLMLVGVWILIGSILRKKSYLISRQ
jgi:hypothetical protein